MRKFLFLIGLLCFVYPVAAKPQIGLMTYTCRQHSFEKMVQLAVEQGIKRIELFAAHVNYSDPQEANLHKLNVMHKNGLEPYAMYAGGMSTPENNRKIFEFAQMFGLSYLVIEPKEQSKWPELVALSREFGIKLALHNHGHGSTYGNPATVLKLLDTYDASVLGVCLDVGWVTAAGYDAAKVFRDYGDRVFDIHYKDKRFTGKEGKAAWEDTIPGDGDSNYDGLFAAILESDWSGTMAIETDSKEFAADPGPFIAMAKAHFESHVGK